MTRPAGARPAPPPRLHQYRSNVSRQAEVLRNAAGIELARCEFCHEPIMWVRELDNPRARTPEGKIGKLIPIDPEPTDDPHAVLVLSPPVDSYVRGKTPPGDYGQQRAGEMRSSQAKAYRDSGGQTYVRHVRTCVKADELRRGVVKRHTRR